MVGAAAAAWPFLHALNPPADVVASDSFDVDLSVVELGRELITRRHWRPILVAHRSLDEIELVEAVNVEGLRDPEIDGERVQRKPWLIVVGVCTYRGIDLLRPLGDLPRQGWYCPVCGSQYDLSGRVRFGPAPRNLTVPRYEFVSEQIVRIYKRS